MSPMRLIGSQESVRAPLSGNLNTTTCTRGLRQLKTPNGSQVVKNQNVYAAAATIDFTASGST